jgi:large subunit ribosomal protein L23
MGPYEVIVRPVDTEKTRFQSAEGQYTFEVNYHANKVQVKRAVEEIFDVEVVAVRTMIVPAKTSSRRGRRWMVRRPAWKKAIVTVAEGERLELFEGA